MERLQLNTGVKVVGEAIQKEIERGAYANKSNKFSNKSSTKELLIDSQIMPLICGFVSIANGNTFITGYILGYMGTLVVFSPIICDSIYRAIQHIKSKTV